MSYKKPYKHKSAKELKQELTVYSNRALDTIYNHAQTPEDVLELTTFMEKFHHYSLKNVGMIREQFPGAYAVGSFKQFNEAGFRVQKGAKAIKIFVPTEVTTFIGVDGTSKSLSTATPEEKTKIAAGELETQKNRLFKLGNVFDISQTDANLSDLPKIFPNRHYEFNPVQNGQGIFSALKAVGEQQNITFLEDTGRSIGNAKGAFMQAPTAEKFILLNPTNSLEENISTSIHELTHAFLHDVNLRREPALSKSSEEFQAEMAAHITSMHFGLDTTEKAIPYIANWTQNGEALPDKFNLLSEVHNVSRRIILGVHAQLDQEQTQDITQTTEQQVAPSTPPTEKIRVTAGEIEKAKRVDLLDYATSKGYQFTKDGKSTFRNVEHDSLLIDTKKNAFHWNSRSLHGGPIDFVQKVEGEEYFPRAVKHLLGEDVKEHQYVPVDNGPFVYDASKESQDFSAARQYLVSERKLSPSLVDRLHQKGYIRQDKRKNVLFLWVEKCDVMGVSEQGVTHSDRFPRGSWKHIRANSSGEHGFNFTVGKPKNLKFFESSIDALSYATLHPNTKDTQFIAMEGLKDSAFKHYVEQSVEQLGRKPDSISFCIDNDKGGQEFSSKKSLHEFYERLGGDRLAHIQTEFPPRPKHLEDNAKWDWNDQAKFIFEKRQSNSLSIQNDRSSGIEL